MSIFNKKIDTVLARDADLAREIARGDADALEIFYNTYFDKLYRYIFFRVGQDHQLTEDIVQDTFIEAVEKIKNFDVTRGNLEAWLIITSKNRITSRRNAVERTREHELSWDPTDKSLEMIFAGADEKTPASILERKELSNLIGATMGALPTDYSAVLEMKYLSNLPVREIARITARTEKSVESQLVRARSAFREALMSLSADKNLLQEYAL